MKRLTTMIVAALAAFTALPAAAVAYACGTTTPYYANYDLNQTYQVTAIAKYNATPCGSGISNSDTAPVGRSTLTDLFAKNDPVTRALLLGITTGLPEDAEGQQHLVVFTNDRFAASAIGIAFGTLFPRSNEADLIAALQSLASGNGTDADYELIAGFAENDAFDGPNGDAAFALEQTFTALAFSDGVPIGTGRFYATAAEAVPEPGTWAMMILGFAAIAAMSRRRRPGRYVTA